MANNKFIQSCLAACEAWGIIPTSFAQSMTWEEQVLWLSKFLQTQVIPVINGHTEAIKAIEHWLDNLDLQEEVDNKLDEMAESGELADIIAQYIQLAGVLAYESLAALKSAENVVSGSFAETYGFHAKGDGGGAKYYVREITNLDTVDNITIVALSNENLVAQLVDDGIINVKQYGAYGDNTHDDYTAIQYAYTHNPNRTIYFPAGTYLTSAPILTHAAARANNTKLDGDATVKATQHIEEIFVIGGIDPEVSPNVYHRMNTFEGGTIDATGCDAAIKIQALMMGTKFHNVNIIMFTTYGIYFETGTYSSDVEVYNCYISGIQDNTNPSYGLYIQRPDNDFCHCRINGVKTAVYSSKGGLTLIDIHALEIGDFADTIFVDLNGDFISLVDIDSCYCDTFQTFLKVRGTAVCVVTNCDYFSYLSNVDTKLFDLDGRTHLTLKNNIFEIPSKNSGSDGIKYTNFQGHTFLNTTLVVDGNQFINTADITAGDPMLSIQKYTPFWNDDTKYLSQSSYNLIGYMAAGNGMKNLLVTVDGYQWNFNFMLERYSGVTYLTERPSTKTLPNDSGVTLELAFKYVGNSKGFDCYAVYLKQPSGTVMKAKVNIVNQNTSEPFMAIQQNYVDISATTLTPDASMTV